MEAIKALFDATPLTKNASQDEISALLLQIQLDAIGGDRFDINLRDVLAWGGIFGDEAMKSAVRRIKDTSTSTAFVAQSDYVERDDAFDRRKRSIILSHRGFRLFCLKFLAKPFPTIRRHYANIGTKNALLLHEPEHVRLGRLADVMLGSADAFDEQKQKSQHDSRMEDLAAQHASAKLMFDDSARNYFWEARAKAFADSTHSIKMYAVDRDAFYGERGFAPFKPHKYDTIDADTTTIDELVPRPTIGVEIDGVPLEPSAKVAAMYWFKMPPAPAAIDAQAALPPWVIPTIHYNVPFNHNVETLLEWLAEHTDCRRMTAEEWLANDRLRVAVLRRDDLMRSMSRAFYEMVAERLKQKHAVRAPKKPTV